MRPRSPVADAHVECRATQVKQFVVLLRGVNVGKGNRVPMAAFRALLESQGFVDIKTLLNSGNAVFSSATGSAASHAKTIGARLEQELGVSVLVVVKSSAEFLGIVAASPFALSEEEHSHCLVAFAQTPAAMNGLSVLLPLLEPAERLHIESGAAYFCCAGPILESKAGKALLGKPGREVTTRNWATVLKIKALLASKPDAGQQEGP
jgi:uncharacterized protein (DUF1697 family)